MKRIVLLIVSFLSVADLLVAQPRSQKTPSERLAQITYTTTRRVSSNIDVNTVRKLLEQGADPNDIANTTSFAETIWYMVICGPDATGKDHRKMVQIFQLFLNYGWDTNTVYRLTPLFFRTPLSVAIDLRKKDLVELFLNHGANADILALKLALKKNDPWIVKMLLDHGADPNAQITIGDHTESPIMFVTRSYSARFAGISQEDFQANFLVIDSLPPVKKLRAIAELLVKYGAVIPSKRQLADLSQPAGMFLDKFRPLAAKLSCEIRDSLEGASGEPQVFPRDIRRLITEEMGGSASLSERAGSFGL